jgi:ribosome biogenesis SPOUT family RNA methylase Rps3
MTTDTAVRVTRTVILDRSKSSTKAWEGMLSNESGELGSIPYVDFPELHLNEHESTEMPFRYVRNEDGSPVMPDVRLLRFLKSS